jgi:predicted NBD/HSP70 family sugar kinase
VSRVQTVDTARMREHNSGLLLNLIFRQAHQSRADLARTTGLSRSTVSAIVDELIGVNLVREVGAGDSRGGRRPTMLEFNDDAFALVGVELGASHVRVTVTNLRAQVRADHEAGHPVVAHPDTTMALIAQLIDAGLAEAGVAPRALLGIGVGVPCPIDLRNPDQLDPTLMPAWTGTNVAGTLEARYGCPVSIDNDANLGALAERWWGVGRSGEDLTYIKIATGVGAGHIIAGEVYRGSNGTAGEIGHIAIDPRGPQCRCGLRGCLAAMVGGGALLDRVGLALSEGRTSSLADRPRDISSLIAAASEGDTLAIGIVEEAGGQLGIAVASLLNLLNPAIVVLGGTLTGAGDLLLAPIRDTVRRRSLWRSVAEARIVTSELGDTAIAIGAATLILKAALEAPARFSTSSVARAG